MFKTRGGGAKGFLNNVQKNYKFGIRGHPLPCAHIMILMKTSRYCRRLVASRDVKPGELVLVENSLILVPTIQVLVAIIFFTDSLIIM